jgi:hydrogenase-4 component E
MMGLFFILFIISLLYLSIASRMYSYTNILFFQGILLFAMSFMHVGVLNLAGLILVLLETLVVKALFIPWFLRYIIRRNHISREAEPTLPQFASLIIVSLIVVVTFYIAHSIGQQNIDPEYFVVSLSSLFTGMYIIISRKKVITHVMGYLVIENGVFVMSLAVGDRMPMLVATGVLFDVFASVLILGLFINKIGDVFKQADVEQLSQLKD